MDRTGVGDTEMARRVGVSRPTLVRWKEGVTTSPRYREDVVRCAEILRLTAEEADEFLLSAGFTPETGQAAREVDTDQQEQAETRTEAPDSSANQIDTVDDHGPGHWSRNRRFLITGVIVPFLVIAAVVVVLVLRAGESADYPLAAPGESLILLAPFANFTGGGQGFNVLGRLTAAIDTELEVAGLQAVRTDRWPQQIGSESEAVGVIRRSGASIVIWGEYDSGRVLARFTAPPIEGREQRGKPIDISASPTDLPAVINVELAEEVSFLAMTTLGQVLLEREEFDRAKRVLLRATSWPLSEPAARAQARFLLGLAYMDGEFADVDEAIWLFTQVLAADPRSADVLNSRALAYLERGRPGDTDRAIDDLLAAVSISPDGAGRGLNLAVAYTERGLDGDLDRALDTLGQALTVQPNYAAALANRAGVYAVRDAPGDIELAFEDVNRALEIEPELVSGHLMRGNLYLAMGSDGDPERALQAYRRAIELAPGSPEPYFNRALAYSDVNDLAASLADLRRAYELKPNDPMYTRMLCWQLAVSGNAGAALPYCQEAVASDPNGLAGDAMGLVNALMGETVTAIADFEAFLRWVDASPKPGCSNHYRPSRMAWIEMLKSGGDPFDAATIGELRVRPAAPGSEPC